MKNGLLAFLLLLPLLAGCATARPAAPAAARELSSDGLLWKRAGGVELVESAGLTVARAHPRDARLVLLNRPESDLPIGRLLAREGFALATNAAMFAADYSTSIGYMRNFERVNNGHIASKLQGFLCWNPKDPAAQAVKVCSRAELPAYRSVFQTHRMIDERGQILWKKGASRYHQVGLVGADREGRVYFFHHAAFSDVHDLVERVLALNLGLEGLLYLDGGTHGALQLAPTLGQGWGSWLQLPNVLGLKPLEGN